MAITVTEKAAGEVRRILADQQQTGSLPEKVKEVCAEAGLRLDKRSTTSMRRVDKNAERPSMA